jgi:hypothetical protein
MDANSLLKRIALFGFFTGLATFAGAAPHGGGHSSGGGGGHSAGGGRAFGGGGGHSPGGGHAVSRGQVVGADGHGVGGGDHAVRNRSSAGIHANGRTVRQGTVPVANSRSFRNDPSRHGDWKDGRRTAWQRDDHGNDKDDHHHHRHDRFFFGFFPIWYPSGGYYGYGYPDYSYDNYDGYYQDNGYYSGQSDSANSEVLVQKALARRGYYTGQVDGVIGPQTRSAIREFQRDNGLAVTGRITPELFQALGNGNDQN